jgi:archaellum component FlaF (FlaF/FlaG flagellin family)
MKKILLFLVCLPFALLLGSCHNNNASVGNSTTITNVHAPTSGSDSIKFTADTSLLHLLIFCPLGGTNHVVVHDMTTGNNPFDANVSTSNQTVAGLIPGDSYAIICYSGTGTTNFQHVASSFRNSGATPTPFAGYTQYYNMAGGIGPGDGVVVILMEE